MAGGFVMALDAGVELITTLKFDGNEVASGVVVGALGTLIYAGAVADNRLDHFHGYESNRSTNNTPFTLLKR